MTGRVRNVALSNSIFLFSNFFYTKKPGWHYEGAVNDKIQPHGKGKLFQNYQLVFKGQFYKGKVELRDVVRKVKDDKKVLEYFEKFGGCHFEDYRFQSVCERGDHFPFP